MEDAIAAHARELHRRAEDLATQREQLLRQRDDLVRRLRRGPDPWTYTRIARAVGLTKENVARIVQSR